MWRVFPSRCLKVAVIRHCWLSFLEKSILQSVVAVGHDDFPALYKSAQGLAFACLTGGQEGVAGRLLEDFEFEVEFGGAVLFIEPQGPMHPG